MVSELVPKIVPDPKMIPEMVPKMIPDPKMIPEMAKELVAELGVCLVFIPADSAKPT